MEVQNYLLGFSYKYQKNQTIIDEKGIVPIGKIFLMLTIF